jgi:hypothetical protein
LLTKADFTKARTHICVKRGALSSQSIVQAVGMSFVVVYVKIMMIGFGPLYEAAKYTTKGCRMEVWCVILFDD